MNIKLTDGREINIVEEYNKLRAENKALQDKLANIEEWIKEDIEKYQKYNDGSILTGKLEEATNIYNQFFKRR